MMHTLTLIIMMSALSLLYLISPTKRCYARSFKSETGDVNTLTQDIVVVANVAAMGLFDKMALLVCAYVASLNIVAELKDIELVGAALEQAGDRISPNSRWGFGLLNGIRRWVFLPALLQTLPFLVMFQGGEWLPRCAFWWNCLIIFA